MVGFSSLTQYESCCYKKISLMSEYYKLLWQRYGGVDIEWKPAAYSQIKKQVQLLS